MVKQILSTAIETPTVTIRSHGDLALKGWERNEVSVEGGSRHALNVRQAGDTVQIISTESCLILLPMHARVIIERVGGDAYLKNLQGDIVCRQVGGDLCIFQVDKIAVEQVGGDYQAVAVTGDLETRSVGGDFIGREIHGSTLVERVGGDFLLQGGGGPVNLRAGGDIQISLSQPNPTNWDLSAGGDVEVHLPDNTGVTLKAHSGSETITLNLGEKSETIEQRAYETTIGDGAAHLTLKAGGEITITSQTWEKGLLKGYEQGFDDHFRPLDDDSRSGREDFVEQHIHEATRRAEKRMQAALHRIDRRLQDFNHVGDSFGSVGVNFPGDFASHPSEPVSPPPPPEPVSNEERLMILRMVETKKITVEEAEKLLQALEGGK